MLHCALTDCHQTGYAPERQLWAAVLIKAIKDAQGVGEPSPKVHREARTWLKTGQADWICNLLNIRRGAVSTIGSPINLARSQLR